MRLLLLSDIHGDARSLERLLASKAQAEAILVAGDLTDFGGAEPMADILELLKGVGLPLVAVPGNCDRQGARRKLEEEGLSADGKLLRLEIGASSLGLFGLGGGGFRAGLTPYERREEEFDSAFAALKGAAPELVLTHAPPFGTEADLRSGLHAGSRSLRTSLDSLSPTLWVCGHIHEGRSVSRSGASLLVNPGSLRDGFYALAELEPRRGGFEARAELLSLE